MAKGDETMSKIEKRFEIIMTIIIIVVPLLIVIVPKVYHYFWSKDCHYEYINLKGQRGKSYSCRRDGNGITCGNFQVIDYIEMCKAK
jgi:hypothetical protein